MIATLRSVAVVRLVTTSLTFKLNKIEGGGEQKS